MRHILLDLSLTGACVDAHLTTSSSSSPNSKHSSSNSSSAAGEDEERREKEKRGASRGTISRSYASIERVKVGTERNLL